MGCEGGDPSSNIWLCAIEHGGAYENTSELFSAIEEAQQFDISLNRVDEVWRDMVEWRHGQNYAKLIDGIYGREPLFGGEYRQIEEDNFQERLGAVFKLNLFPIAFKSLADFSFVDHLGFRNKNDYYSWAAQERTTSFTQLISTTNKPRVLICAGLGKENEFRAQFFPHIKSGLSARLKSGCRYVHYHDEVMHIFVTPALTGGGKYCLSANDSIAEMASVISKVL